MKQSLIIQSIAESLPEYNQSKLPPTLVSGSTILCEWNRSTCSIFFFVNVVCAHSTIDQHINEQYRTVYSCKITVVCIWESVTHIVIYISTGNEI